MKRVLLLDQFGDIGGAQRILLDLVSGARAHGIETVVACPEGPLMHLLQADQVPCVEILVPFLRDRRKSLGAYIGALFSGNREATKLVRNIERIDLVVVNGPRTLAIARALKKPTVIHLHNIYRGLQRWILRHALTSKDSFAIAASPFIAASMNLPSKVKVIPNWVSPEFLTAPIERETLRSTLGIQDELPIVLVPGRLSPTKGQLQALESLRYSTESFHLVFTGKSLFESEAITIEQVIRKESVRNHRVHWIPWEGSMTPVFDGSDLVTVPSVWQEPFGLTSIEAMSRGIPLIVSDRGALPWIAEEGKYADIVEPSPEKLAAAIDSALQRGRDEKRLNAARESVLSRFQPDTNRRMIYEYWKSCCR